MDYHLVIIAIITAFIFDFINGFHDAANAIATIVATKVLTPRQAVLWASFFNFIALVIFSVSVAKTIGTGLIDPSIINEKLILSALLGAISWNLITWFFGLPSSSSHALVGGLAGAGLVKAGFSGLIASGFIKIFIGIFLFPLVGLGIGWFANLLFSRLSRVTSENQENALYKTLQLISSAFLSMTHGGNDAQKTMGIIAILLYSKGLIGPEFYIPWWVIISCYGVISLGTLFGGWRIVNTLGNKITHLNPLRGCAAETGASSIIYAATALGIPVSTTHMITGAIAGVGVTKGLTPAQWRVLKTIFFSWILTLPASAIVSALMMQLITII